MQSTKRKIWTERFITLTLVGIVAFMGAKLSTYATVTPIGTDKVVIVDDPAGTPLTRLADVNTIPVDISQLEGSLVAGDVLYASGADTVTRLAKGSDTEVLTLASGLPSWAAPAGGGGTVQGTDGTYDIQAANEGVTAGNARGENSVDLQTERSSVNDVAAAPNSVIMGGEDNWMNAGASHGSIGGGFDNYLQSNGDYSSIGGGYQNNSWSQYCAIGGGRSNAVNSSSNYSAIGGGQQNNTNATYSTIPGGYQAKTTKYGQLAHAAGQFSAAGDAQASTLVARKSTTDATPAEMFLDNSSSRCTIASDTTWLFRISLVARRTDADNESFGATYEGVIDNNAGTTALVGSVTETVHGDDPVGSWSVSVTADDTNDALKIQVTGEAAKTIRWVARIELTEVTG